METKKKKVYVDYARIEAQKWIKKINKKDPLKVYKKEAMKFACDLKYNTHVFELILEATNGIQIDNALRTGRNVGNELKFNKIIKNGSQFVAYC